MEKKFLNAKWLEMSGKEREKLIQTQFPRDLYIVYLDDQEEHLEIFSDLADGLGFKLATFDHYDDALTFIKENNQSIALIVSDINMPAIDGFEFRRQVFMEAAEIPFFFISGQMDQEIALKSLDAKVTAFLAKPFNIDEFKNHLVTYVDDRLVELHESLEMLMMFLDDARNLLDQVEDIVFDLEENYDRSAQISLLFGMVHTIKGSSGFFNPRHVHNFAHRFEDEIKIIQSNHRLFTPSHAQVWLKATEILRELLGYLEKGKSPKRSEEEYLSVFLEDETEQIETNTETKKKEDEIKVALTTLDDFMQTSGEMTIIRNLISKTAQLLETRYQGDKELGQLVEYLETMDTLNSSVQSKVVDLRKVALKGVCRNLKRAVKEASNKLEKDLNFTIEGEDLKVDHHMAESLSRALIHMVRNSVDHGIETAHERAQTEKAGSASINLSFVQEEENIFITLQDDGRGFNLEKIKEVAVAKGIRQESDVAQMKDKEICLLIFEPGFSTNEEVSEFSGRGVGMSMVMDVVQEAGGSIDIQTAWGEGSTVKIVMPVPSSVLIKRSLMVSSNDLFLGIPQEDVKRVIKPELSKNIDIKEVQRKPFLLENEQLIPIFTVAEILAQPAREIRDSYLVVVQSKLGNICLALDDIIDLEDAVIRKMGHPMAISELTDGVSLMEAGKMAYIFNTDKLAKYLNINSQTINVNSDDEDEHHTQLFGHVFVTINNNQVVVPSEMVLRVGKLTKEQMTYSLGENFWKHTDKLIPLVNLKQSMLELNTEQLSCAISYLLIKCPYSGNEIAIVVDQVHDLKFVEKVLEPRANQEGWMKSYLVYNQDPFFYLEPAEFFHWLETILGYNEKEMVA